MSPRRKNSALDSVLSNEMTEEEMFVVSGGISRLRPKCPVPGCGFECGRMTELNLHMRQCHPEKC